MAAMMDRLVDDIVAEAGRRLRAEYPDYTWYRIGNGWISSWVGLRRDARAERWFGLSAALVGDGDARSRES